MPQVNQVPVSLKPHIRFAIAEVFGEVGSPEIRDLVFEALAARNWNEERMLKEYSRHVADCYEQGTTNRFATTPIGRL